MKKMNSVLFTETLQEQTRAIILQAEQLKNIPFDILDKIPANNAWSVAQVLEHLNIYCRYYLTAIEKKLHHNQTTASDYFTPGWLGNYFTKLMQPAENGSIKKKMKSPANAQPAASPDAKKMLAEFLHHQHHLLNLLSVARQHNMNSNRIPISISKLISLKMGDTFNFILAHQRRHFIQIENTLDTIKSSQLKKLQFGFERSGITH